MNELKNLAHVVALIGRLPMSEIEKETNQRVIDELRQSFEELEKHRSGDVKAE